MKSSPKRGKSASRLIDGRIRELGDWRGQTLEKVRRIIKEADPEVIDLLARRSWPGNVRELRNVVERMVILSGERITAADVPGDGMAAAGSAAAGQDLPVASASDFSIAVGPHEQLTLREFRDRAESQFILLTLRRCDWNISRASGLLGIERTNLHKKMRSFGIKREG
jgi:DNA-binding NtrC family response regulator